MKKTLPVLLVAAKDEAARLAQLATKATVALKDVTDAIKDGLMAFSCSARPGSRSSSRSWRQSTRIDRVGAKGRHDPERSESAPGSVILGGQIVPVRHA